MNALHLLLFLFFHSSESASIRKNDTLEILKNDVSQVGSAIENITFDILREIVDDSEEHETTTVENNREKRSTDDDVKQLCQTRCEEAHKVETQQIKDLKIEVKKLQEMVKLLQDQQKIIDILDDKDKNTTKTRADENEDVPNTEELVKMKRDLAEAIQSLNRTKVLIEEQKEKDEFLEVKLMGQEEEILKLKKIVAIILHRNETFGVEEPRLAFARSSSSDLSGIKKLLKSLPEDDEDDDDEDLQAKIQDLQKQLTKKRKTDSLMSELKKLTKSLDDDKGKEKDDDSDLLRELKKALKKPAIENKTDDLDITNLAELKDAIDRLRPKEDNAAQFQAMLNQLINNPANQRPSQITVTPQQMNELTKKLTPNNNNPYICIVDDGGVKSNGYRVPVNSHNYQFTPPVDYGKSQQFFQGQYTQPNYYAQGTANGASPEKSLNYQAENGNYNQKYQEDLRQQIDGLQAAIDNLNRPEYVQRPEDKSMVDDLERQIGDLRNVVTNLNYDGARYKRSPEDNEVDENDALVDKMTSLLNNTSQKMKMADIQVKIDKIKNQLDGGDTKARTATQYAPLLPLPQLYPNDVTIPSIKDIKKSAKNDIFVEIISNILDKILSAIPAVIQRLFNFSIEQLSKYDSQDYDVQVLYKNLGIFAYLPVILLRLLKGFTAFMNMLKKSSFFRNFLMPAIILGTVAGAVLFLIWWLQPDGPNSPYYIGGDTYDQYSNQYPQNNQYSTSGSQYSPSGNQYSTSGNQYSPSGSQYPASYNFPTYSRSYFNK